MSELCFRSIESASPSATFPGPSRTITVEPVKVPAVPVQPRIPPELPDREPEAEPAREPVPAH